jgi:hypothetical protein
MIIHPNPNSGKFTVELIYVTNKTRLAIFDHNNVQVYESKVSALETELEPKLPKGDYTVKILENNSVIRSQKLTIQ